MAIVHGATQIKHINHGADHIGIVKKADGTVIWADPTAIYERTDLVDGWQMSNTQPNIYRWAIVDGSNTIFIDYGPNVKKLEIPNATGNETVYTFQGKTYIKGSFVVDDNGRSYYNIGLLK